MLPSSDPTFPLFPIMSFLGFIVCLIPLPWHLQAWNSGTCAFMIWTSLACLLEFINTLAWSGNLKNNVPVWCDISSKILLVAGIGITASILCITRRLYSIATVQQATSYEGKRRNLIIDICIAFGIPMLVMVLHVVVQPHRYNIVEDVGCFAAVYNTIPTYFLVFMWPILLGCISFVYSALTLRVFWKRRLQFAQFVSTNSNLSFSRYLRLMLLAITDMMLTVPLSVFSTILSTRGVDIAPYISWDNVHYDFGRVDFIPALFWRSDKWFYASIELTRWLYVLSAFIFFALFGFASEAQKNYREAFNKCRQPLKKIGVCPKRFKKSEASCLPSHTLDSVTITPMSPTSTKSSYFPSFFVPGYSKSLSPSLVEQTIIDVKRPQSASNPFNAHDHDTFQERYELHPPFSPSTCTESHTICDQQSPKRFSWKSISLPFSDRRNSSYF